MVRHGTSIPVQNTHTHIRTCLSFSGFSFDITMRLWVVHMIKHGKIHAHYIYTHMYVLSPDSLLAPIAPSEIPRSRRRPPEKTPLAASGAGQTPRVVAATNNEAAWRDIPRILLLLYDWLLGIFQVLKIMNSFVPVPIMEQMGMAVYYTILCRLCTIVQNLKHTQVKICSLGCDIQILSTAF